MAQSILIAIGGPKNITTYEHCVTRLRLTLEDPDIINEDKVKSAGASGIIRPSKKACQIVIGTDVQFVYDEFEQLLELYEKTKKLKSVEDKKDKQLIIKSKNIYLKDGFCEASISVENGVISSVCNNKLFFNQDTIDYKDFYIIPGLIDIHSHGCNGHDFCEGTKAALDLITQYQIQHGVTSFCPTTMTFTEEILVPIMQNAANYKNDDTCEIVGINMEGPFISKDKIGAQNPDYVQAPDFDMLERLQESANGLIKLVDIAPEIDGAVDFIRKAKDKYIIS